MEYLILCDAVLVVETADCIEIVTDKRFHGAKADLPLERLESWKAQADESAPRLLDAAATREAAHHALIGSFPLTGPNAVRTHDGIKLL